MEQTTLDLYGLDPAPPPRPSPVLEPPRPAGSGFHAPVRVPLALLKAMPSLDGAALKVFLLLAATAEGRGVEVGTLSVAQIASTTGLCPRMVQKALGALERHGLLWRHYQPGRKTAYRLVKD